MPSITRLAALVASFLGVTNTAAAAAAAPAAPPPPPSAAAAPLLGAGRAVQQPPRFRAAATASRSQASRSHAQAKAQAAYGVQDGSAGAISQTKGGVVGPDLTACAPGCDWPNSYKCCGGKCVDMEMPCE